MKRITLFLSFLICAAAIAQVPGSRAAAFVSDGSGNWTPASTTATAGAIGDTPPSVAVYCFNSSTGQWVPATSACLGGGGGSGTVTSVDVTPANGVSATGGPITTSGTFSFSLGAITPSSVASTGALSGTTITGSGAITATADGTHAGIIGLAGNTTLPTIPSNQVGWLGFNSTSATAYFFQPSTTAPANSYMIAGAPSGNVSQVTYVAFVADTTITVGSGVAFSANTCSSYTGTGGTASTTTMTGLATSMTITHTPTSDVHAVTGWSPGFGGSLYFTSWPTANTLNDYVCNPTGSTITTGGSVTWNVSTK